MDFLKSTEFGGKLRNSDRLKTLVGGEGGPKSLSGKIPYYCSTIGCINFIQFLRYLRQKPNDMYLFKTDIKVERFVTDSYFTSHVLARVLLILTVMSFIKRL